MPNLNFDYTQFLKKQNSLYLLKYQNDPIRVPANPEPIAGYHGHVPCYRSSIHEQRMVRSLVRCLTSPTKPTTATGFKSATNRLPGLERPSTATSSMVGRSSKQKNDGGSQNESALAKRAKSAPPESRRPERDEEAGLALGSGRENGTPIVPRQESLPPSRISMMSAGSSEKINHDLRRLSPFTPNSQQSRPASRNAPSRPGSTASTVSQRPITRAPTPKHPTGYPQTLYGASFWYMWPDQASTTKALPRPESFEEDRRLNRNDDVLYHKHEGVVPKYMGYVPGYKFRHGSTFGVLTSHATNYGAVFKREIKGQ